jgi:osmotically-inducible protein OsmY
MADRWDERNRNDIRDDRYRDPNRSDRGMMDRAADEVRSWAGDEDAARRRRMDEMRDDYRERDRGQGENAWGRARETFREATDRDRDGRRGLSEWNDNDRPGLRGGNDWANAGRGIGAQDTMGWNRDRDYGDRQRFIGGSQYGTTAPYGSPSTAREWQGTNYAGRGPRGYQRGDERIREDVCDRLTDDPRVDAEDIEVRVSQGEVTLSGSVRSRDEKRFTEDLVERISGVREVNNNLKVRRTDEVLGTARSGASVLGLSDNPPPPAQPNRK